MNILGIQLKSNHLLFFVCINCGLVFVNLWISISVLRRPISKWQLSRRTCEQYNSCVLIIVFWLVLCSGNCNIHKNTWFGWELLWLCIVIIVACPGHFPLIVILHDNSCYGSNDLVVMSIMLTDDLLVIAAVSSTNHIMMVPIKMGHCHCCYHSHPLRLIALGRTTICLRAARSVSTTTALPTQVLGAVATTERCGTLGIT